MPRRPPRSVPLLILHGLGGPLPGSWYTWLADEVRGAEREVRLPELPNAGAPVLGEWLATLDDELRSLPEAGFDVVAQSTGSLLWLHHAALAPSGSARPARVALVAPADAAHIGPATFRDVPLDADAVRRAAEGTVLVGGENDPYCPRGVAVEYGTPLKMATTTIPGGGHLNPDTGYGPWPAMLDWCRRDNLAFY